RSARLRIGVETDDLDAGPRETPRHVRAHAAQSHHAQLLVHEIFRNEAITERCYRNAEREPNARRADVIPGFARKPGSSQATCLRCRSPRGEDRGTDDEPCTRQRSPAGRLAKKEEGEC